MANHASLLRAVLVLFLGSMALWAAWILSVSFYQFPSDTSHPSNIVQASPITLPQPPSHLAAIKQAGHMLLPQGAYYQSNHAEALDANAQALLTMKDLLQCVHQPNPITNHVRLSESVRNISLTSPQSVLDDRQFFNPTILALPSWSRNEYLLVSRVVTEGLHQETLLCEANICYPSGHDKKFESTCSEEDLKLLGPAGGLRCVTEARVVDIPATPAEQCDGKWRALTDIPGFHDPRIFWSGKGEPLIIVNSHSQYGCLGLWFQDLRSLHPPLESLLQTPQHPHGPLMSYATLTELTRSPAPGQIEKNWFLFFPTPYTAFVHYDIVPPAGRSFAKLIGNGFTTPNLTDVSEAQCLTSNTDSNGRIGEWHQASNSLKLILCKRGDGGSEKCDETSSGAVHFALVHRKFTNDLELPMRYERHFIVWSTQAPYSILARSTYPVLLANETASGWTLEENLTDGGESETGHTSVVNVPSWINQSLPGDGGSMALQTPRSGTTAGSTSVVGRHQAEKPLAYFSYTPSINWARRRKGDIAEELFGMQTGYLDDEVVLGIGFDDVAQGFAKVKAESLLSCLTICPSYQDLVYSDDKI